MIYKDFQGERFPLLGFGCMRLPLIDGDYGKIDEVKTAEMVDYAISNGVKYFDTAWGYHNGNSEISMGNVLKKYDRKSFYLTSKFPGYDLDNMDKVEEIFEKQLKKCQVDYFDFYLFHNVCELNINQYLDRSYGIYDYLLKQKQNGRIKHLGFSVHGSLEVMNRFLEAYGKSMEFCQVQLNYLDWDFQDAKSKVKVLKEWGIPVWVMEPVRGGKLAKLPKVAEDKLKSMRPDETIPAWAFRFVQSVPEVKLVLSGMSNMAQVKDNIKTFDKEKPLTEEEKGVLFDIGNKLLQNKIVPCTACKYCTSHCPQGLDIPRLLELYNEHNFAGGGFLAPMALDALEENKRPNACLKCRSCEAVCPQTIKISEILADFNEKLK